MYADLSRVSWTGGSWQGGQHQTSETISDSADPGGGGHSPIWAI